MLNFIYWPVSGIMWVWQWVFSHILPDSPGSNGVVWALSVIFLVFTLRAILYKPFVKQIRTTRQMQEIQPQLQAIRKKYAKDRVKMTEEMQKLQKEHGFNPLLGCLPMLAQIPVFIGLFHVLRSFNRMGTGFGQLDMSAEQTRSIGNYAFSADQVQNFLDARLFGVPLSSFVTQPEKQWKAFLDLTTQQAALPDSEWLKLVDFSRAHVIFLVIPLVIISSIATHMNSRASVARQGAAALENPQTAIMNKLALYVFPLGILVSGAFFPVAILLYWVSNNLWTYGQQHIVFNRIEKEDEAKKAAKQEKLKANAPKPGARPERAKKKAGPDATVNGSSANGSSNGSSNGSTPDLTKGSTPASDEPAASASTNGAGAAKKPKQAATKQPAAKTPRPGQKPSGAGGRAGAAGSNTARRKKRR